MKQADFHALLRQHIPQIHYLETDTAEIAEGECTLWGDEDCTFIMELANPKLDCHTLTTALQTIAKQLQYLETQREWILQTIATQQAAYAMADGARVVYVAFWVEDADAVCCDLACTAPAWGGQQAVWAVEDGDLIFQGFEAG